MNVSELILALQKLIDENKENANLEVTTEGCDCDGAASEVVIEEYKTKRNEIRRNVYIKRH